MNIVLLGRNGQVAWELQRSLSPLGQLTVLDRNHHGQLNGDLTQLNSLEKTLIALKPDVIINAAAFTAVDLAEKQRLLAQQINSIAPAALANIAKNIDALLIHYSSDYVFNGSGIKPWVETDCPDPLNFYGKTKLEGELAIQNSGCKHIIFRTSWVYGLNGNNFIKTILRLANEKEELQIINDQIGAPTGADYIADITAHTILKVINDSSLSGLYHLSAAGETSWYEYACRIIDKAASYGMDLKVKSLQPILSLEYKVAAQRPLNSRLCNTKFLNSFGLNHHDWKEGVDRALHSLIR